MGILRQVDGEHRTLRRRGTRQLRAEWMPRQQQAIAAIQGHRSQIADGQGLAELAQNGFRHGSDQHTVKAALAVIDPAAQHDE